MKETTQTSLTATWTAALTLISGIVLCFFSFFRSDEGAVDDSVLFYFGQCLVYAGSVFGLKGYIHHVIARYREPEQHGRQVPGSKRTRALPGAVSEGENEKAVP